MIIKLISDNYKDPLCSVQIDIISQQFGKMAPKINKSSKTGKQTKIMNYPIKRDEYIKEINQANRLEKLIRKYNSLNNTSIPFKEFTHALACEVILKPLEIQHRIDIDITKSYLLRWQHIVYLSNFNDWAENPQNVPFIGPDQNLYKIIP